MAENRRRRGPALLRASERRQEVRIGFTTAILDRLDDFVTPTGQTRSSIVCRLSPSGLTSWKKDGAVSLLPDLHSEAEVAERFKTTVRVIRERARAQGLGRTIGRTRWFTPDEALALMEPSCSSFQNGKICRAGMSGGLISEVAIDASTKTSNKADAQRFKTDLEVKIAQSAGRKHSVATFAEAADLYLEFRRPKKADRGFIERLCAVIGEQPLAEIRQHILVQAANVLYPQGTPATKNRQAFGPAAAILHYAADNDLCPYIRVKKLKEKRPEPRALSKEDAARLIAASDGRLRLLLVFLFSQGWRISDALRLQWQDVDLSAATVRYHVSKTDEWLTMPLSLTVFNALRTEPTRTGRVFPWGNKSNLYRDLRAVCRKAEVFFTPHMARHSFATWLASEGVSAKEIMEAGAWRDHKSVMRYTNVDERRVRATVNLIQVLVQTP